MSLVKHVLAKVIGSTLSRRTGLQSLTLPRGIPAEFIRVLADAANSTRKAITGSDIYAIVVVEGARVPSCWDSLTTVTSEETAKYRTKTTGGGGSSLVISYAGDFKALKTLEAFREVFPQGAPFGDTRNGVDLTSAEIGRALAREIVAGAQGMGVPAAVEDEVGKVIDYVLGYLCDAYKDYGNELRPWVEAWWLHADGMVDELGRVTAKLPNSVQPAMLPYYVFAAAGLPRPDKNLEYADRNGGNKLANTVSTRFDSQDEIAVSLAEMGTVAGNHGRPSNPHELERHIDWERFQEDRLAVGHGLLAFLRYGAGDHGSHMKGWLGTYEQDIFSVAQQVDKTLHLSVGGTPLYTHTSWPAATSLYTYPRPPMSDDEIDLGPLVVRIPFLGNKRKEDFPASKLIDVASSVRASPKALKLDPLNQMVVDEGVELHFAMRIKRPKAWRTAAFKLIWSPDANQGLHHYLESGCSALMYLPVPSGASVFLSTPGKKKIQVAHALPDDEAVTLTLKSDDNVNVVFCFDESTYGTGTMPSGTISVDLVAALPRPCSTAVFEATEFAASADDHIGVDTTDFILSTEFSGERPWLPIIATACKLSPRKEIPVVFEADLRAQLERYWLKPSAIQTTGGSLHASGLCQAFLVTDSSDAAKDLEDRNGMFMAPSLGRMPLSMAAEPSFSQRPCKRWIVSARHLQHLALTL
jgi:hypothetical protein